MTIIIPTSHAFSESSNEIHIKYIKHLAQCLCVMIADAQQPLFEINRDFRITR